MNKNTGKLFVFLGLFMSLIVSTAAPLISYLNLFLNLFIPQILGTVLNILSIASCILVVLGFFVVFVSERKILDLLIAAAFAAIYVLNLVQSFGVFNLYTPGVLETGVFTIITFAAFIPYVFWFIKLIKTTSIGAISVLLSVLVSIFLPSIINRMLSPADAKYLLFYAIMSFIVSTLRAFAAYRDMRS